MADVLILYASTHGHTAKIARRIADAVGEAGLEADVEDARSATDLDLGAYSGVIVGASIHGGHHQGEIVDWVKRHADALSRKTTAFFSVCLSTLIFNDNELLKQVAGFLGSAALIDNVRNLVEIGNAKLAMKSNDFY